MKKKKPKRDPEKENAMLTAMIVRNAMEDFHVEHLSDAQMKELNPIIRNAIYTAIRAMKEYGKKEGAKTFIDFSLRMIPDYWEPPVLLDDYKAILKLKRKRRPSSHH